MTNLTAHPLACPRERTMKKTPLWLPPWYTLAKGRAGHPVACHQGELVIPDLPDVLFLHLGSVTSRGTACPQEVQKTAISCFLPMSRALMIALSQKKSGEKR